LLIGQKEHLLSQLIQDLNKEIEFHDQVIRILRDKLGREELKQKADEMIMDMLANGRPLKRDFLLREELLLKIKKTKAKIPGAEARYKKYL